MTVNWSPAPAQDTSPCAGVGFPWGETLTSLKQAPWFPTSISTIGHKLLDRVVCLYDYYGVALPERRIWVAGEVPYDCNQLIVSLDSLAEGLVNTENQPQSPCNVPINATFNVTVVRCYPVPQKGGPVSPEVLAEAADKIAIDAYLLMKLSGCLDMHGADTADNPSQLGGMGTEASISISNAEGGVQAVTLELTTVVG